MEATIPPATDLADVTFCAFDLETTGLSPYSRVLEIGAVRFRPGGEPDTFSTLVRQGLPIQAGARAVHGIDESMLEDAPPPHEAVASFVDFCGTDVLVAHNARFDVAMLSLELTVLDLPAPPNPVLDSLALSRRAFQAAVSHRLEHLVRHLEIEVGVMHRALPDAMAVRGVVEAVLARFYPHRLSVFQELVDCCGGALHLQSPLPLGSERALRLIRSASILPALESRSAVYITYLGGSKGDTARPVRPIRVFARNGVEYLEAHCLVDDRRKVFRVDLIADIE